MNLYGTSENRNGSLYIGGISAKELVKEYGTPLYVMDEAYIRSQAKLFKDAFTNEKLDTDIIYASKAFLTKEMARLTHEEGLCLDVVSGGELYTAYKAGYPLKDAFFHGNAKTKEEIAMAIEYGVGTIILDNEHELDWIEALMPEGKTIRLMVRINPGVVTDTHEYIRTTMHESKFGVTAFGTETIQLIQRMIDSNKVEFVGTHSHIGSQIFDSKSFLDHVIAVASFYSELKEAGITVPELNLGGGFGIPYTTEDPVLDVPKLLSELLTLVVSEFEQRGLTLPKVFIEPGRSLVGNAGTTLYETITTKQTFSKKNYVFVDGSMADHIRTALYQAKYDCAIVDRLNEKNEITYAITGRACESGDMIIRETTLPEVHSGDIIAVSTTGAYHYSMASNYNRFMKPAVIFVKDGTSKVVVKRETLDDLLRNDV